MNLLDDSQSSFSSVASLSDIIGTSSKRDSIDAALEESLRADRAKEAENEMKEEVQVCVNYF